MAQTADSVIKSETFKLPEWIKKNYGRALMVGALGFLLIDKGIDNFGDSQGNKNPVFSQTVGKYTITGTVKSVERGVEEILQKKADADAIAKQKQMERIKKQESKRKDYRTMAEGLVNTEDSRLKELYIKYAMLAIERTEELKKVPKEYFNGSLNISDYFKNNIRKVTGNEVDIYNLMVDAAGLYLKWKGKDFYEYKNPLHFQRIKLLNKDLGKVADEIKLRLGIR